MAARAIGAVLAGAFGVGFFDPTQTGIEAGLFAMSVAGILIGMGFTIAAVIAFSEDL